MNQNQCLFIIKPSYLIFCLAELLASRRGKAVCIQQVRVINAASFMIVIMEVVCPQAFLHMNIVLDGNKSLFPLASLPSQKAYFLGQFPIDILNPVSMVDYFKAFS
jgi:hypothetical protein